MDARLVLSARAFGPACIALLTATATMPALADRIPYSDRVHLTARTSSLVVNHCHDWSRALTPRLDGEWRLAFSRAAPFGVGPDISSLELYLPNGTTVARLTSPPLRYIKITPDSRYVIGLSDVRLLNSTQALVLDGRGTVLLRRQVSGELFCLSRAQYDHLTKAYPRLFERMARFAAGARQTLAWRAGTNYYLDPAWLIDDKDWPRFAQEIAPLKCRNPLSANISESVTNWVRWYDLKNPDVRVIEQNGVPAALSLRDAGGVVISMPFREDVLLPAKPWTVGPLTPVPAQSSCPRPP